MKFNLKGFKNEIEVTRLANIQYFEFTNEYHTVKHSHHFRELVYVDCGEIIAESESYYGKIKNNELIIHKPDENHTLLCTGSNASNVIIIGFECECEKLDMFSARVLPLSNSCQEILTKIIKEGMKVFLPPYDVPYTTDMKKRDNFEYGADQMIKLNLELFLLELIRLSAVGHITENAFSENNKNNEIHNYIKANYKKNINLNELCFLFGTNKTTLCSSFKAEYGCSIISYINNLRIKKAKELMRTGNMSLSEISEDIGFSSLHYFSRCFKKAEKISPSQYIKSVKSKLNIQ